MKSQDREQQIESFLLLAEFVNFLVLEYKQNPTRECFAVIDALITELREWMIFIKNQEEDFNIEIIFPE